MPKRARDAVDGMLEEWGRERPDLRLLPMGIVARLARLFAVGSRSVGLTLAEHGLNAGEFDVLASLRRAGSPHVLTPTQLARALMLSSGAMTNRLDRLEQAGLIERRDDPGDRRGILVGLTATGLARVDVAVSEHVASEAHFLAALSATEQHALAALLRKLLVSHETR